MSKYWEVHADGWLLPPQALSILAQRGEIAVTSTNKIIVKASTAKAALMKVLDKYVGLYPKEIEPEQVKQYGYMANVIEVDKDFNIKPMKYYGTGGHFFQVFNAIGQVINRQGNIVR